MIEKTGRRKGEALKCHEDGGKIEEYAMAERSSICRMLLSYRSMKVIAKT
jgi:hypothetical protein